MRRMKRTLAALLAAALLPVAALAEGTIASDLSGDWLQGGDTDYVGGIQGLETGAIDVYNSDLLIGYVAAEFAALNPLHCVEWDLVSLNQLVFESLVELNDVQKPSPMLADSWKRDGKTWTFSLRKGIVFHNGAELTAYDVVDSYKAILNVGSTNPYYGRLNLLVSEMQAVDSYTVAMTATVEGYIALYAMTFPVIQSSTLSDTMPRGTGPYWYIGYDGDSLRLEANPLWWKQQPSLQSITAKRHDEVSDAIEALHTNEIQMLSTRSSSAAINRKLADFTSMDYATMTFEMLLPNISEGSLMADSNARKSVMYAIDRAEIASSAYLDMAVQSEVPVLPGTWLYESQSAVYYYSPERALQLMYDSGWEDLTGDVTLNKLDGIQLKEADVRLITYNDSASSIRANAAYMIEEYLEKVGFNVTVEVLSQARVLDRIEHKEYELALIGVNLSEVPVLNQLLGTGGSLNLNRLSNDTLDELLAQTGTAATEEELKQVFSEIQLMLAERLPIMGLLFRSGTVLSTRSLGGLEGLRAYNTFRGLEYISE